MIRWRCGLAPAHLQRLRGGGSADCRDLKIYVGRIGFDQLGPERAAQLGAVETRFKLPVETVDALIAAGGEALAVIRRIGRFSRGCEGSAPATAARKQGLLLRAVQPCISATVCQRCAGAFVARVM